VNCIDTTFFHATAAEKRQKARTSIFTMKIAIKFKHVLHQNVAFVTNYEPIKLTTFYQYMSDCQVYGKSTTSCRPTAQVHIKPRAHNTMHSIPTCQDVVHLAVRLVVQQIYNKSKYSSGVWA